MAHAFYNDIRISIHALVKRATKILKISTGATFISIHALVKRATGDPLVTAFYEIISIHALVKRATVIDSTNGLLAA